MDEYKHKKEELMNLLVQHSNADMDDEFQPVSYTHLTLPTTPYV